MAKNGKQTLQMLQERIRIQIGSERSRPEVHTPESSIRLFWGLIHTGRACVTPANGTCCCQWECSHCTQATSKEKRSNLRRVASRVLCELGLRNFVQKKKSSDVNFHIHDLWPWDCFAAFGPATFSIRPWSFCFFFLTLPLSMPMQLVKQANLWGLPGDLHFYISLSEWVDPTILLPIRRFWVKVFHAWAVSTRGWDGLSDCLIFSFSAAFHTNGSDSPYTLCGPLKILFGEKKLQLKQFVFPDKAPRHRKETLKRFSQQRFLHWSMQENFITGPIGECRNRITNGNIFPALACLPAQSNACWPCNAERNKHITVTSIYKHGIAIPSYP